MVKKNTRDHRGRRRLPGAGEPAGNKAAVELWIADHHRAVVEFEPEYPVNGNCYLVVHPTL